MNIDEINKLIVRNIESLIEEVGSNPTRMAKDSGLGYTSIRDILTGTSGSPRYETLLKIAKGAGVDIRRITVGPNFDKVDPSDAEMLDLWHQLEPSERMFLANAAKAQIEARDRSRQQPGETQS